ncbi:MAG: carboxypeptidase-like regulatory domain-containing protein [Limisphaerales bacterium]
MGAKGRIIDLEPFYNIRLDDPTYDGPGTKLPALGKEFDGLPFQLHGQIVLFGRHLAIRGRHFPTKVSDIPIDARFEELHLLHHSRWPYVPGQRIARIVLNYEGGTQHEYPIVFGDHVRDWHYLPSYDTESIGDPNGKAIWRDMTLSQYQGYRRLWKTVFHNPHPTIAVKSMDLISDQTYAAYSLIGATVAMTDPKRKVTPHLPFTQKRKFTDMKITVTDVQTGKPIDGALIEPGVTTKGAGVVTEMLLTDQHGEAIFKYWGSQTTRISWTVMADGYLPVTRGFRNGNFPAKQSVPLQAARSIAGTVQDDQGQPIEGAFIYPYNASTFSGRSSIYGAYAVTDDSGRWKLNMMPRDLNGISLTISHRNFARRSWTLNATETSRLKAGRFEFTLKEGFVLAGQVTNAAGKPVEKAVISYGSNTRGAQYRFTLTDQDGYYVIHVPDDSKITLSASKRGWNKESRSFQVSSIVPVQDFNLLGQPIPLRPQP